LNVSLGRYNPTHMTAATCFTTCQSPVGTLLLVSDGHALTGLYPERHRDVPSMTDGWRRDDAFFSGVRDQLSEYFGGRLMSFEVEVAPRGTEFQREVWSALEAIPLGQTCSYGAVAYAVGRPTANRAVGSTVSKNPISIIIPCHRVVGADGALTGYAGGLELKQKLLDLESGAAMRGWQTAWTTCPIGIRPTPTAF
jgi:methylated-DNA-[protein]-cysteine S-methyltransferase